MKMYIHTCIITVCISLAYLVSDSFAQPSKCGTPLSCYEQSLENLQKTREQVERYEKLLSNALSIWKPMIIDCHPSHEHMFSKQDDAKWEKDLYPPCKVNIPGDGILYLSLQGHQHRGGDGSCSFGIFLNNESIDKAAHNYPSHTYSKEWQPSFMAEAVAVNKGDILLSVRMRGQNCEINNPDIDGIFIPILKEMK